MEYESAPYILKQANQYPIEKLRVALNREPAILLVLYELSIYEKILGIENKINKDLYFKIEKSFDFAGVISVLFQKCVISQIRLDNQERMYQVTVRGITQFGHTVMQLMQNIPHELQCLYCSEYSIDRESSEGLYVLNPISSSNSNEIPHSTDRKFKLIDCSNIKSIDVSCLTLSQLCQNEVTQYLMAKHDKVYLSIDIYPKTDIRLKQLIWQ